LLVHCPVIVVHMICGLNGSRDLNGSIDAEVDDTLLLLIVSLFFSMQIGIYNCFWIVEMWC